VEPIRESVGVCVHARQVGALSTSAQAVHWDTALQVYIPLLKRHMQTVGHFRQKHHLFEDTVSTVGSV
jgi:hypothetical protein